MAQTASGPQADWNVVDGLRFRIGLVFRLQCLREQRVEKFATCGDRVRNASFDLFTKGHQLIHLRDDAVLHGECQEACPKGISIDAIMQLNRDFIRASATKVEAAEWTGAA